ncbi:MAG: tyrosine-protein phosphatase [Acidimicrobiia bacterium]
MTIRRNLIEELAERINFRDLGGMITEDGKTIVSRMLFRSGLLTDLEPETRAAIENDLGVRKVIDIRRLDEIDVHPPAKFEKASVHRLPLSPVGVALIVDPVDTYESVADWYWRQLTLGQDTVRKVFDVLAEDAEGGVIIHCHAGKDRTGVIIALVLTVLGAPREAILADYAVSRTNTSDAFFEALPPRFSEADPQSMDLLLDRVDREYGSVENYLKAIGVGDDTIDAIRRRYLGGRSDEDKGK